MSHGNSSPWKTISFNILATQFFNTLTEFQQASDFILNKLKKELPPYLTYHNAHHTLDVIEAAGKIAIAEAIDEVDKRLLLTAALFHDTGFLIGRGHHESASCGIARRFLPAYNYTPGEIEIICDTIMATCVPQLPNNHLQAILCDADLDYLGRDDFFVLSNRLFSELSAECLIKDKDEWNREQAAFMTTHHYHTATSIKLRQHKKEEFVKLVKSKIQITDF